MKHADMKNYDKFDKFDHIEHPVCELQARKTNARRGYTVYRLWEFRLEQSALFLISIEREEEPAAVAMLSCDRQRAEHFFGIACEGELSPLHLMDAAQDFVANLHFEMLPTEDDSFPEKKENRRKNKAKNL